MTADLVIEALALAELEALDEAAAWRALAVAALTQLHAQHSELERVRAHHHRLLDEYRRLRAQVMSRDSRRAA